MSTIARVLRVYEAKEEDKEKEKLSNKKRMK